MTQRLSLRSLLVVVASAMLLCLPATSRSGGKDKKEPEKKFTQGEDHLKKKARWEWKLFDGDDKKLDEGTFMGYVDGNIRHGKKQELVGKWEIIGKNTVAVSFTWRRLEGNWTMKRIDKQTPTYDGTQGKGAAKKKLHVEIFND